MQLTITGHHIDVTPALKNKIESKLAKVGRHFDHLTNIHCILTVEKLRHKAEATVHLSGGTIHADAIDEDMYAAVDALVDKLSRQVTKHKEKLTDHHAREAGKSRSR
ncbi:MAG TPA: ribosome-associated translation inhibitor RaiA [Gammaproteobacteria bacterium]|nr:ribosome-associated translation inhibitor RaiA [Gammaproteobacteria bacterium]